MIREVTQEYLGYPRADVFTAGLITSNWPIIEGLRLRSEVPTIGLGDRLRAELSLPVMNLGIDCEVVDFVEDESVRIEGRSKLAKAALLFSLRDEEEGTAVHSSLELHLRSMAAKLAAPAVKSYLAGAMPQFAREYKSNIISHLGLR